jgi:hypothetical protein
MPIEISTKEGRLQANGLDVSYLEAGRGDPLIPDFHFLSELSI